ncbi:MAG: OmpA family protein [Proteobacteria bacterium]|nr:OmpA family protein [Pseudomonadota bacterium]
MAATSRRSRTRDTNIWPGFVDALATLLMVIIFVLMVFIVAQFYLTQLLSGRDEALGRLQRQISELSELLALERESGGELRLNVAQLSDELQASIAVRDTMSNQVSQLLNQRDQLEDRLAASVSQQATLKQRIVEIETSSEGLNTRIAQIISERDALLAKLNAVEERANLVKAERDELDAGMADTLKLLEVNQETIKLQLRDLESLRRDIAALNDVRQSLEGEVAELAALRNLLETQLREARQTADRAQRDLEVQQESARLTQQELSSVLEKLDLSHKDLAASVRRTALSERDVADARALLGTMLAKIASERQRGQGLERDKAAQAASIAEITALLGAARDQTKVLTNKLAQAGRQTVLAQRSIEERDIRLEELLSNYNLSLDQLTDEQKASEAARQQVALLNRQLLALRQQLASLQQALDASDAASAAQNVKILDLGKRLNKALASKVQELARFRSEFFGRLREVLKNRQDIHVVGDRFVFQSEVLFESASATIAAKGKSELRRLAGALNEIGPKIPSTIQWILQVEGHTDQIPIFNEQFRSNWDLSAARAISVVQFLIRQGVPAHRLSASGYGEFQPIDERRDEIGNRRNRRIEMKLTQR